MHYSKYFRHHPLFILILVTGMVMPAGAQISPGDLTKSHAQLEGMLNCTKCHVLGDKVSNDKCLECHKELKARIDQKKGYHASTEVKGKDCFTCHSDHHGRAFNIVRFDTDKFDHQLTGYKLTGAHIKQDCIACHKDERIESADLRKKEFTYLGLKTECIACHRDAHQNTLDKDCASCHNTEAFSPAPLVDHGKTDFPLKGQHKDVDCNRCHEITFENSALLQHFAGVPFNTCAVCHEDVHKNAFGQNCKECHNEESFHQFGGQSSFNHSQTRFPLEGKHKKVDCASCHQMTANTAPEQLFKDYKNKDFNTCVTCHEDIHEARLGIDCKSCHTVESFQKLLNPDRFDHGLTGYALEGKHKTVDCRKCHENKATDPLPHDRCIDCHEDYHQGQMAQNQVNPDCTECHTVQGFPGSTYTVEKHNAGRFPLEGAHLATPCLDCHHKEDKWAFKNIGENCIDCHDNVHVGYLDEKYYPQQACSRCHTSEAWTAVNFDHTPTGFGLQGKHQTTTCVSCHKPDINPTIPAGKVAFTGLKQDCISCHDNVHDQQFEVEGVTDCTRCHAFEAWKPSNFDHNTARFILEGAHKDVACEKCHKEEVVDGRSVIKYKLEQFECANCHK